MKLCSGRAEVNRDSKMKYDYWAALRNHLRLMITIMKCPVSMIVWFLQTFICMAGKVVECQ